MRDLRDPSKLGEGLLSLRHHLGQPLMPLSELFDAHRSLLYHSPDYDHNPGPVEKYGDPRLLPSTLPN